MAKISGPHDFLLRVPEDLWERFIDQAAAEGRTANQQLVWLMRQFVEGDTPAEPAPAGKPRSREAERPIRECHLTVSEEEDEAAEPKPKASKPRKGK